MRELRKEKLRINGQRTRKGILDRGRGCGIKEKMVEGKSEKSIKNHQKEIRTGGL